MALINGVDLEDSYDFYKMIKKLEERVEKLEALVNPDQTQGDD